MAGQSLAKATAATHQSTQRSIKPLNVPVKSLKTNGVKLSSMARTGRFETRTATGMTRFLRGADIRHPMSTEQKDVYICYNGADFESVKRLVEQIESETIDGNETSRHLTAFFDKWDIAPGQSLIDRMNEGMKSA